MAEKISEKERTAQLKALRRELESQMEQDLRNVVLSGAKDLRDPSATSSPQDDVNPISPKRILEALLFASGKPLMMNEIRKILTSASVKEVEAWIQELKEEYAREGRSFELIEIAGGYEIVTRKEYANWLARLELQKRIRQASRSALETLAILAYKQPVTRAEVEEIRGVDISGVLTTLLERGFVKITGKKEVPGRPFLYGTTEKFLEHFGLKSVQDLPPISEIKTLVERAVRKEEFISESEGPATEN